MRGGLITIVVLALAAVCVADMEGIDPSIPRDKCGVTIGTYEDDTTAIFILGSDRMYYYKYEIIDGSGNWSDWISLGGNFKGGPSVVRSSDGRLVVIGRGSNNYYWSKYQSSPSSNDWTKWSNLGTTSFATDPIATLSSEGFIHVFGKGDDNTLMHKTQYTNNSLFMWTDWTCLGGSLTSQPAVLLDAEGLLHVFVRGPDRALWTKQQVGGQEPRYVKWGEWQSLGGVLASAPRVPVSLSTVNLLDIFVRASDKAFWHREQVASLPTGDLSVEWNDWQSLGGVFASGPSAVINGEGLLESYGRGVDKAIWRKYQSQSGGSISWSRWSSLRGITSSGPSVRVRSDGLVDIFVRGVDKQIWVKSQYFAGNSTDFDVWRSHSGSVLSEAFMC